MKKTFFILGLLFLPLLASAADSRCPDYCAEGTFYTGRTYNSRSGFCSDPTDRKKCDYGCDGREKCLAGKDCPSKCEDGVYSYRGAFSASAKDCQYTEKKCDYGCKGGECASAPVVRECNDYCQSGTFYSTGKYNASSDKCEYKNNEKCVCDSEGKACVDVDCSNRCSENVAYFDGKPTADGKCKFDKEEKCKNGCDKEGKDCSGECRDRCYKGNFYNNGIYQSIGTGGMSCVFEETKCPVGCELDSEGCKRCQKDADCSSQNVCKDGMVTAGRCDKNTSGSGCAFDLIQACLSGECNPLYGNMCAAKIGPANFTDPADGKLKPISGAKVTAIWKTASGEVVLPERATDESGNINFSDEEKYKYFNDPKASLAITVSLENFQNKFNVFQVGGVVPSLTRTIVVSDQTTYPIDFNFGSSSDQENAKLYFQGWEGNKDKISVRSVLTSMNRARISMGGWVKDKLGAFGQLFYHQ
jgi:hypothetical protein